ncbi:uncharacterized protein B0T15DRAFT_518472 [Chaetomium strumarium]|uniref:Uncharacterized protein n=1 Tax=Chaetomium strumarium TaxID=1170767 RepID=A0AAJ0H2P6_9PEZI|nr:hypothetical protein B0T15DRAFT_518472 [Chaetomium strumarium]
MSNETRRGVLRLFIPGEPRKTKAAILGCYFLGVLRIFQLLGFIKVELYMSSCPAMTDGLGSPYYQAAAASPRSLLPPPLTALATNCILCKYDWDFGWLSGSLRLLILWYLPLYIRFANPMSTSSPASTISMYMCDGSTALNRHRLGHVVYAAASV